MKRIAGIAAAAAGLLILAGCSSSSGEPSEPISTDAASGTLTYESWTPTEETMDEIVSAFREDNPDVKVQTKLSPVENYKTALQAELRSGQGPDVFVVEPGGMLSQYRQYIEPVDDYAKAFDGKDWASAYRKEPLKRAQIDGVTYGLPSGYGVAGFLWVNKTLLDKAGVDVPTTYKDLVAASKTLSAAGITPIALGGKDTWQDVDYFLSIAASIDTKALYAALEGKGSWTDPHLVEAFEAWKDLFTDHVVQEGATGAATYNDSYDLFTEGKAAFFANGSWNLDMYVNSLDKIKDFEIDAIPLPVAGSDDGAPITGDVSGIVVVNKASKNKSAAFQLAEFMSRGPGAQILLNAFLNFPVTSDDAAPTNSPEQAAAARASIEKMIENRLAGYRQVPSASVAEALGQALVGVGSGTTSPKDAAQRVQDAADAA